MSQVNTHTVISDFTEATGQGKTLKAEPENIQFAPEQTA